MYTSHGYLQGYNAQALVDSKNQIITYAGASGEGQDYRQLEMVIPGAKTIAKKSGFKIKDVLTHIYFNGFPKGYDLKKMKHQRQSVSLEQIYKVADWVRSRKSALNLRNCDIDQYCGVKGGCSHWSAHPPNRQAAIPPQSRWMKLIKLLGPPPEQIKKIVSQAHGKNR